MTWQNYHSLQQFGGKPSLIAHLLLHFVLCPLNPHLRVETSQLIELGFQN